MPSLQLAPVRRRVAQFAALLVLIVAAASISSRADDAPPHVVMISIDGLKPEAYTQPGPADVPTLRKLAADGAYARGVIGVFPTVTYPSHTTLITGVTPVVHGIYNNRMLDPEDRSDAAWYWYARDITAPTLPGAVRARGLTAAVVNWPVTVGFDADYVFPEYFRSSHRETLSLLAALSRPTSLIDDVEVAEGKPLDFPLHDKERTTIAAYLLKTHRPNLTLLHIFESDSGQHQHGPGSPEALKALAGADREVARILEVLDQTGMRAKTNVVIVSDHGFLPLGKQLQPNAVFKNEGWIKVDARGRITSWDVYYLSSGGSGFVFLKNPDDAALRDRVAAALAKIAADPANGVEAVVNKEQLTALGADPRASFAIDMKANFYSGGAHDVLLTNSSSKGGHGFMPTRPELHSSLIMAGPNVPKAGDLGIVRMTQIAPTIASWFGVGLSPKADTPLTLASTASRP